MKKVQNRIQFWRDLGFFEKYRKLSDEKAAEAIVRISEDSYWGELSEDMEELDLAILSLEKKKVWFMEDFYTYGSLFPNVKRMYISALKNLSKISGGGFLPADPKIRQDGFCDGRSERWVLSFLLEEKREEIIFCGDLEVLTFCWVSRINELIQSRGLRFCVIRDGYGAAAVFCLSMEKAEKLSENVQLLDLQPESFWQDAGDYCSQKGDYEEALLCFEKSLSANPQFWHVYASAALCCDSLKLTERKNEFRQKAVSLLESVSERSDQENWYLDFFLGKF
ncbi:MAG TPA: tetratricopeptide repeat protein [Leptospiraceae bacterium]|nr:tetratricopeptide repeat protein [Leptospiraceae bacterium]